MTSAEMFGYLKKLGISRIFLQGVTDDTLKYQCYPYGIVVAIRYVFNWIWKESEPITSTASESTL